MKPLVRAVFLFLLLENFFFTIAEANDPTSSSFDVTQYDISIAFDLQTKTLTGRVLLTATSLQSTNEVIFNASPVTLTIDSVFWGNKNLLIKQEQDVVHALLPVQLEQHTAFELAIYYHGMARFDGRYDSGGVYIPDSVHFTRLFTSSEPTFARCWWPCKDSPSDKAPVRMHVTVPDNLIAASNGLLRKVEKKNGLATYHWETHYPIATYLVSLAVAPYIEQDDIYTSMSGEQMPITYYVYPNDTAKARIDFQNIKNMLRFLSDKFGEYPFIKEKFGIAEVDGNTTMENQTLCSIQTDLITGKQRGELTFLHEMAHHWWGDLVTPTTWNHTWLSEGFAQYTEALYLEHTKGIDAYRSYINRLMAPRMGAYAGSIIGKSDTAFWDSFAGRVYFKGALVLHMLRGIVRDSLFFSIMKQYANDPAFRYGNARTEDFVRVCEKTSTQPLQWFFNEWVYATTDSIDRPVYEYAWTVDSSHNNNISLTIEQPYAEKLLYRMPFRLSVWSNGTEQFFPVVDSLPIQNFSLNAVGKVDSLNIDRDGWVFKSMKKKEKF